MSARALFGGAPWLENIAFMGVLGASNSVSTRCRLPLPSASLMSHVGSTAPRVVRAISRTPSSRSSILRLRLTVGNDIPSAWLEEEIMDPGFHMSRALTVMLAAILGALLVRARWSQPDAGAQTQPLRTRTASTRTPSSQTLLSRTVAAMSGGTAFGGNNPDLRSNPLEPPTG